MKLCWDCKYFYYRNGDQGYSELTPGWDISMDCQKNHWTFDPNETTQDEFKIIINAAKTCPDYSSTK